MRWLTAALVLATGCATLDTRGMSASCRDAYNRCLDGCPNPPPNLTNQPADAPLDETTPSCVETCNDDAKACR